MRLSVSVQKCTWILLNCRIVSPRSNKIHLKLTFEINLHKYISMANLLENSLSFFNILLFIEWTYCGTCFPVLSWNWILLTFILLLKKKKNFSRQRNEYLYHSLKMIMWYLSENVWIILNFLWQQKCICGISFVIWKRCKWKMFIDRLKVWLSTMIWFELKAKFIHTRNIRLLM